MQQAQLQTDLAEAEAARDAEADRLDEEDAKLAAAAAAAAAAQEDQALPTVNSGKDVGGASDEPGSEEGSSGSAPAATALINDLGEGQGKDVEMGAVVVQQQQQQQGGKPGGGWFKRRSDQQH